MAGQQLTDNSDIRNALAGIYRHFQTIDRAHLFDAFIAEERSTDSTLQQSNSAHPQPSPSQENQAFIRYVTKIPCNASDGSGYSTNNMAVQTETMLDNKLDDRLSSVEEDVVKLRTEFSDLKQSVSDRLNNLEKLVQEIQEKTSNISDGSNINSNNTSTNNDTNFSNSSNSGSTNETDLPSGRSDNSSCISSSDNILTPTSSENDYMSIRNATTTATTARTSTGVEHIYDDPGDFYPDSMPRYRAPPVPSSAQGSIHLSESAPSRLASTTTSASTVFQQQQQQIVQGSNQHSSMSPSASTMFQQQQQQQQQQRLHQTSQISNRHSLTSSSPITTATSPLSRVVPPSQPRAQSPTDPSAPRPPPRTAASSTTSTPPNPPTSTPPPRPQETSNVENQNQPPLMNTNSVSQIRANFQNMAINNQPSRRPASENNRSRNVDLLRSLSNPNPLMPPPVRPRVKPRISSVGAPGFQIDGDLDTWSENPEEDSERHESGTLAIRGIRTRPGLDIQTGESDTLVIGPVSPFIDSRPQTVDMENSISTQPVQSTNPLSVAAAPNTIHSIMFTIDNMSRFKAATKKLGIQSLGLDLECSLKLQSKDQLVVRLDSNSLPASFRPQMTSSTRQRPPPQQQQQKPQTLLVSAPTATSASVTKAHICIIHLGRDVSDDKILDQGWVLNIHQPCSVLINPKELFKVKGIIKLLVEIKLDDMRQSHC